MRIYTIYHQSLIVCTIVQVTQGHGNKDTCIWVRSQDNRDINCKVPVVIMDSGLNPVIIMDFFHFLGIASRIGSKFRRGQPI